MTISVPKSVRVMMVPNGGMMDLICCEKNHARYLMIPRTHRSQSGLWEYGSLYPFVPVESEDQDAFVKYWGALVSLSQHLEMQV